MKVGWVRDLTLDDRPGGAQRCERLLKMAAPTSVELIECPPGNVQDNVDAYIALRCQLYTVEEIEKITSKPCFHWAMDYWEWTNFEQRQIIFTKSRKILFGSPLHKQIFVRRWNIGQKAELLPYPIDVEKWLSIRNRSNGRSGAMWYGENHPYKGPDLAVRWSTMNQIQLDIYGVGMPQQPSNNPLVHMVGQVSDSDLDLALATHEKFVHFPRGPEGFCYSLMEAWLAGLEVIYAGRIGLDSWEKDWVELAEDCNNAPRRFWEIAEQCLG